jgi:hypothetical protein
MKLLVLIFLLSIITVVSSSCKKSTTTTTPNTSQPSQPDIIIGIYWEGSCVAPSPTIAVSSCWYSINGASHIIPPSTTYDGYSVYNTVHYAHIGDVYTIGYSTPIYFQVVETNPTFTTETNNGVVTQTVTSNGQDNENNKAAIVAGTNTMTAFSFTVH